MGCSIGKHGGRQQWVVKVAGYSRRRQQLEVAVGGSSGGSRGVAIGGSSSGGMFSAVWEWETAVWVAVRQQWEVAV